MEVGYTDTMTAGHGYWFKMIDSISFVGSPLLNITLDVDDKWNMVGSISVPVPVNTITSNPPGMQISPFYRYDSGGYRVADTVFPGHGYWVRASQIGQLFLSSTTTKMSGRIVIRSDGEMPPAPPEASGETPVFIPTEYSIGQNYPNPFNPTTTLTYALPTDGIVQLRVYNVLGQEVAFLENDFKQAGVHTVQWDASAQPSGVYLYKITAGPFSETRKMLLIR
jgi:hypothetical protein